MSEDALRKIQALIDKAHSTTFEAEARALLQKADALMVKYSVEAFQIMAADRPNTARPVRESKPEQRTITLLEGDTGADPYMRMTLSSIFRSCAQHLFVRVIDYNYREAKVLGYPVDLDFLEMYFLKIKLHMFSNMLMTVDSSKPWVEVLVGLKNMGYKWIDCHYKLREHTGYPYRESEWERRFGVTFTAKMKKFCEENDVPRNSSSNPQAWREDFLDGFSGRLSGRLREMRQTTLNENPNLPALLNDKKSEVDEAYYDLVPSARPHPEDCQCDTCHFMKCSDDSCTRPRCVQYREDRKKPVRRGRAAPMRTFNRDAYGAGRTVAEKADLSTTGSLK